MGKWTPGFWAFRPITGEIIDDDANTICDMAQSSTPADAIEQEANAYLIAKAPAMAEALEQTAAAMDALHPSSAGDMSDADYARLWNATRDALETILARISGDAP